MIFFISKPLVKKNALSGLQFKQVIEYRSLIILLLLLSSFNMKAQEATPSDSVKDIYEMSLEQLWNTPIEIASKKIQTQEEAPSIVTVITSDEIQKYGYKDLADVLRMVPGFEFGIDVQSLYGLGFRGIWAHEGKALVMINGMAINCFGFGNGNFFGTYPISLVDKIEILRGPGSAIYGGFAEVAVVNVITKKGGALNGSELQASVGSMQGALVTNGSVTAGFGKDSTMDLSVTLTSNSTPVSSNTFHDFYGDKLKMNNENSWRKFTGIYVRGGNQKLKFAYNNSYTNFLAQDGFGAVIQKSNSKENTNELNNKIESFNIQYQFGLGDKVLCTPKLDLASGNPISSAINSNYTNSSNGPVFFNIADPWQNQSALGRKAQLETEVEFALTDRSTLLTGLGYQYNHIRTITAMGNPGLQTSDNPGDTTSTYGKGTTYGYVQYSYHGNGIGFITGARYENTPFGNALAPRIGFTFSKSKLNAKVLYGRAFRAPLFWQAYSRQFNVQPTPLKPEFSNSYEMEVGYKFDSNIKLSTNIFFIDISTPIVYLGSNNSYNNFGKIQSMGVESDLQVRYLKFGGFLNASYTLPGNKTSPEFLDESEKYFLSLPTLKINGGMYYKNNWFTFSPSFTYLGSRYGQSRSSAINSTPSNTVFETTTYSPLVIVNTNFIFSPNKIFEINVVAYNLFDSQYAAIQPYYGGHAPLPATGQQISIGLKVHIK